MSCASCDAWNDALAGILTDLKAVLASKGECDEANVLRAQWCEAFGLEIKHVMTHLPAPKETC